MNNETQDIVKKPGMYFSLPFEHCRASSYGWNELWKRDICPWDKGVPSPALVEVIEQKPIKEQIPKTGNVLVPGCGRGVDVFYLGNENRKAYGLDISPIAVQLCKDLRTEKGIPEAHADFIVNDFFKFEIPADGFQLVYDYTFFCAIPPSLRPDWGRRMGEIITKGGILITLMYPFGDHTDGPPFAVTEDHYHSVLDASFECLLIDNCTSFEARKGREKIGVWRRK
ncbi:hypothetical protein BGZ68_004913 [Mortierella alpina]|nr:hypothetical protein BGZ68_004913 [Mortierella alpina]